MLPKLTDEQRKALEADPDGGIELLDDQTHRTFLLVPKESLRRWIDRILRRELQIGFDQADVGDVAEWDIDEILSEAHRRHATKAP